MALGARTIYKKRSGRRDQIITTDEMSDAHQRFLLAQERSAEIQRSSLLLSNCGPKLLEQKGLSLAGLGVVAVNVGLGGKTLAIYSDQLPRPGDLARVETNVTANSTQKKAKKSLKAVVYKISDTRIVIATDPSDSSDDLDLPERCRVLKIANSVTYDRYRVSTFHLFRSYSDDKNVPELTPLVQVLMAMTTISKRIPMNDIQFFDKNLNPSQKEAVKFCLESPEVACIHGPPGTGKTHTLIEIIRQLSVSSTSEKPRRLLVCGASNLSVDNILERLLALPVEDKAQRLKVTRIGHPARVMAQESVLDATLDVKAARTDQAALAKDVKSELEATLNILSGKGKSAKGKRPKGAERKNAVGRSQSFAYRRREGGVVEAVLGESQIVLATCHSSGGRQLRNHTFDVVIIDEATQALEAVCWIPIFKVKKLILAGDPMQLPPTVLSVTKDSKAKTNKKAKPSATKKPPDSKKKDPSLKPPRTLETTLFDRLEKMYGPNIKRMLQVQYRMHSQICEFPSITLYESKLESHDSVASHLLSDVVQADADEETIKEVLETPVVFFDTAGCEYFERLEGDGDEGSRCNENEATVVKQWIDKLTSMGLLASQIAVITPYQAQVTLLTSLLRPQYGSALEIGTVDGMQGREKDAVIISLVRSNDKREVGFLKEKRRLNVAMTRAKRHLCVVGDSSTVRHGGRYLKTWLAWLDTNADVRYAGLE
ncbi:P-loop containing nucleoside triphosphate hydrolase protein [Armillaria luteobubalina]|uniref:DNA helicase n=1 Tax=Armillaria luteobubalina TaxID=153913 RepID=A0AA39UYW6_9AGAR|nr:P-loop containing nucleoside triphosphate hydrolase protein [Armillaria luteobubalina]